MNSDAPLIMLSGMGADARVFEKQREAIPQMIVPEWINPHPRESLASYAARLADKNNPGKPCYIGGASFGGFLALEMIQQLDVIGSLLVGSVRSSSEFPRGFQSLRKISRVADVLPFEVVTMLSKLLLISSGSLSDSHLTDLISQMSESDASFLRWACRAVLEWDGEANTGDTAIYQIHGEKDFVLPPKNTKPDAIIANAGHAISMSHPDDVIQFLKSRMTH